MRILFMGTPDFAAASLKAMTDAGLDVVGVVSQPDRPKGRGHKLVPTDVKAAALEAGIENIYQPEKLRNGELQPVLDKLKPELIVVVAYGKILPDYIIDYPKYGCVNVHASLLPKYRGAGPIQWAIINGEKVTGVTTMKMDSGLDTGDMLEKVEITLDKKETGGSLFDKLSAKGAALCVHTLAELEKGDGGHIVVFQYDALVDFRKGPFLRNVLRRVAAEILFLIKPFYFTFPVYL